MNKREAAKEALKKEHDGLAKEKEEWERKALEEHKKRIDFLRKANPDIDKWSKANCYRFLWVRWLRPIIVLWICFGLGFALTSFLPLPQTSFEPSKIDDIAKSIIAPSITINGLFTTFFPVIGFFYVAEIDGKRKEGEAEIKEQIKNHIETYFEESREDDLKTLNHSLELNHAFWENLRNGFLKYIATCIIVSVLSLLSLLPLYVFLTPAQFIFFDIPLLSTIAIGILPIIQVTMIKTPSQI